ncbi:MAG: hypothetical protein AB7P03_07470 [Kofleriaceae bacterium]
MLGRILTVSFLLGAAMASPAVAQPRGNAAQKKAEQLTKQAIAKSQAGDHAAAIDLYKQAYDASQIALLLSNIGNEYRAEDKPVEALKYLCMYLEKDPTGANANYVKAQAVELEIELGKANASASNVCTKPIAAKIEPPPVPAVVEPPPEPAPSPPVDTPPETSRPGGGLRITGMVVGGLGLAALGVGSFYSYKAYKASQEISNWPDGTPWPENIKAKERQGERYEKLQIAFLAGGGAAAILGAVLYWRGSVTGDEAERITIAPVIHGDTTAVTLGGQF